jgi:hypothetical protein
VTGVVSSASDQIRLMQALVSTRFEDRRERLITMLLDPDGHALDPDEAARIEAFLRPLLRTRPDERPGSAGEALAALEQLYDRWRPEEGRRELARRVQRLAPTRLLPKELVRSSGEPPPLGSSLETASAASPVELAAPPPEPDPPRESEPPPPAPPPSRTRSRHAPTPRKRRRQRAGTDRTVAWLAGLLVASSLLVGGLLGWSLLRSRSGPDRAVAPSARVAAVDVAESPGGTSTVTFRDGLGEVLLAPVLPGTMGPDAIDLVRGADGLPLWALVGTGPSDDESGVLVLFDLRGNEPQEAWRLRDFFAESPEVPIGAHRATGYGFDGVALLPSEGDATPAAIGLARDRFYAPSWMLRVSGTGEVQGKRYHPGHLRRVLALDGETLAAAGVSNRLCPGGRAPCGQSTVLWIVAPPRPGESSEFPPGCGGGEMLRHGIGYSWDARRFTIVGLHPSAAGMTVRLKPPGGDCVVRLTFGRSGEYEGQYSDCGLEAPMRVVQPQPEICAQWADAEP